MKILKLVFFLMLCQPVFGQHVKHKTFFIPIHQYITDLNNDGLADTIVIGSTSNTNKFFNKIIIKLAGYKTRSFVAKDSWALVDKSFLNSNENALKTKMIYLKKTSLQSVILLFGESYGSGERGEFSIINIENNKVQMVFDHEDDVISVENPIAVTSFESENRLCFIYNQPGEFDEILKYGNVGVYSPYYVYLIDDSCKLNKPLTKAYNEKNYVFAGYQASNKLRVYYPDNNGRPTLLKRKRKQE